MTVHEPFAEEPVPKIRKSFGLGTLFVGFRLGMRFGGGTGVESDPKISVYLLSIHGKDMDLRLEKYSLMQQIMGIDDERLLKAIAMLLEESHRGTEHRISMDRYNQDLEDAERDFDENGGVDLEEVRKKMLAR